ncbi:hypothetical protein HUN08_10290 [Gordonia sp. X0973]|uniref:hypothetical protein n=1 Tax=Gordonia sp. X0973 TaxID=2742602 RepID=UPI000F51E797|nr:hypothetical protein [Gordonia sp. X0973]QKT07535.1 hypothetical protein HUN08_10290 [Gordonia sp. X0973]
MSNKASGFSFIKLALASLSAGMAVLVVSLPLIWLGSKVTPWLGLIIGLAAIVGIVAAVGFVSNRMVERAAAHIREERDASAPGPLDNR